MPGKLPPARRRRPSRPCPCIALLSLSSRSSTPDSGSSQSLHSSAWKNAPRNREIREIRLERKEEGRIVSNIDYSTVTVCSPLKESTLTHSTRVYICSSESSSSLLFLLSRTLMRWGTLLMPFAHTCLFRAGSRRTSLVCIC